MVAMHELAQVKAVPACPHMVELQAAMRRRLEEWFDRDPFGNAMFLFFCYLGLLGVIAVILALVLG